MLTWTEVAMPHEPRHVSFGRCQGEMHIDARYPQRNQVNVLGLQKQQTAMGLLIVMLDLHIVSIRILLAGDPSSVGMSSTFHL